MHLFAVENSHTFTASGRSETAGWRRAALLVIVFALAPILLAFWVPHAAWLPCLWLLAAGAWLWSRREATTVAGGAAHFRGSTVGREHVRRVLGRFAVAASLLIAVVALAVPERLFDWPREHPFVWLAVMLLYPLLSVVPQEVLYRRFFFQRFGDAGGGGTIAVFASALAFGVMHAVYQNVCAVVLTLIGGWFFADTYRRTSSLKLVCVEHALYGNLIFTVGLGDYFTRVPLAS